MFQYAAGRRVAVEHGLSLLVDTSILEDHSPGRHEVNRHYGLEIFKLQVRRARTSRRWIFNAHGLPLPAKLLMRFAHPLAKHRIYREGTFPFDERLLQCSPPPRYIRGLWQSYRYFDAVEDTIARDFEFCVPLPRTALDVATQIQRCNAVCLHVRRGDYVHGSAAASMGFLGTEYYQAADRILRDLMDREPKYFVFSDDIPWCRRELGWLGPTALFVGEEFAGGDAGQELHLMSQGANFIIPNSTFGWWAAWLSKVPGKRVVAPARWFADRNVDTTDLCPPSWIRI